MKKIDVGVVVTTLIIVTISCSLAFFAARVVGNPKDINLVAKNVAITFTDTSSIADETISPGWNNVKSFTITNNSKEDFNYNILLKGLVNTFESINTLQYKITSDTGYNMDNYLNIVKTENSKDVVLAYDVVIPKGSKQTYQVEFKYISIDEDQSSDMGKRLGGTLAIEESTGKPKIYDKLLSDNPTIKTRTDFSTTLTETNVNTLYKTTEDNTDVYYFAGDAKNNWVKFGGYYWRIIRTNSDGSIRLLYAGTSSDTTQGYISRTNTYNEVHSDAIDVGYMYGTSGSLESNRTNENSSSMKELIDNWYKNNLIDYTKYLSSTAVYCNDREVTNDTYVSSGSDFNFDAYKRIAEDKTPTYNCANIKDAFSVGNKNAKLDYPIALMTADEISYAGGVFKLDNHNVWYNYNSNDEKITDIWWWLMTPWGYQNWYKKPALFVTYRRGQIGGNRIEETSENGAVRPVISINGNNIWKNGDGSATNPYEVVAEPVNTYTVSLSVNNGSGTGTVLVEEGKDATFTVTPNSGYKAELETDTCSGTLSGNTYTVNNITSGKTCSITFKKNETTLASLLQTNAVNENGYRYEGANPNNYITMEKTDGTTELWRIIGLFPDGANGENVIRVRKVGYESAAYDQNDKNYWPNTTLYTSLKSIYSTAKYKNTINYKIYLGTSSAYKTLTAEGWYTAERGTTAGASAGGLTSAVVSVGLMYPSDYGYGVLASECDRTLKLYWGGYSKTSACYDDNWLFQGSNLDQWLISPNHSETDVVVIASNVGCAGDDYVSTSYSYSPVMALKSDVMVTGSGTQSDPYVMQ